MQVFVHPLSAEKLAEDWIPPLTLRAEDDPFAPPVYIMFICK